MAKLGRRPNVIPTVEWKLHIRQDLAGIVELLLLDPVRQKVRHGARGQLMEQLLAAWVEEQRKQRQQPGLPEGATFNYEPGDGSISINEKK